MAVALLTRQTADPGLPDVPREQLLGDTPPGEVLAALEVVAGVLLKRTSPAGHGQPLLEAFGVAIAEELQGGAVSGGR